MQRARWFVVLGLFVLSTTIISAASSLLLTPTHAADNRATIGEEDDLLKLSGEGLGAETLKKLTPTEKIKAQLQRKVTLELNQGKLDQLANVISKQLGINVILDKKALEEAAFDTATPIDKVISEPIELRHALRLVLNDLGLSYVVDQDVLNLTTKTKQENWPLVKVYPVGEFVRPVGSLPTFDNQDYDSLIQLIQATIPPTTWNANGGQGGIVPFDILEVLVISNTQEVHEQLEVFFADLRKIHAAKAETVATNDTAVIRQVYPLVLPRPKQTKVTRDSENKETVEVTNEGDARFTMEELTALLKKTIEPATWNDDRVSIAALGETLIVTHTQATQRKIHRLLIELGLFAGQQSSTPKSNNSNTTNNNNDNSTRGLSGLRGSRGSSSPSIGSSMSPPGGGGGVF